MPGDLAFLRTCKRVRHGSLPRRLLVICGDSLLHHGLRLFAPYTLTASVVQGLETTRGGVRCGVEGIVRGLDGNLRRLDGNLRRLDGNLRRLDGNLRRLWCLFIVPNTLVQGLKLAAEGRYMVGMDLGHGTNLIM